MASPYVTTEEKILRMCRALRACVTLDSTPQRLAAYGKAEIPSEDIVSFDDTAVRREELRRNLFTQEGRTARRAS